MDVTVEPDTRLGTSFARWPTSGWGLFLLVFSPVFAVFLLTANRDLPYHIDAVTNVYSAWTIGTTGSPVLSEYEVLTEPGYYATYGQVVESTAGPISQYPPGTALLAAPLYGAFARDATVVSLTAENETDAPPVRLPVPDLWPAALVAAGTAAIAVSTVAVLLSDLGVRPAVIVTGVAALGFGTGVWSVAADALWQHGPDAMWLALGILLASRGRWIGSGLVFGVLAFTRLPVVLVGIAFGVDLLVRRRFGDALRLAAGTLPGLATLVAYNQVFFDGWLTGGYGDAFTRRITDGDASGYLSNVVSALIDSQHGLIVWSPFVVVAALGVGAALRSDLPRWPWFAALGGLAYMALQLKANRASGGDGFSYYRYPIETLVAAAPVLVLSGSRVWAIGRLGRIALGVTIAFAIVAHAVAAV